MTAPGKGLFSAMLLIQEIIRARTQIIRNVGQKAIYTSVAHGWVGDSNSGPLGYESTGVLYRLVLMHGETSVDKKCLHKVNYALQNNDF